MLSVLLSIVLATFGPRITVYAPNGCYPCYVQIDTTDGLAIEPQIFQFDLAPGETFGHSVMINHRPLSGGSMRVRVWTDQSLADADADQTIAIPPPIIHRVYVPML